MDLGGIWSNDYGNNEAIPWPTALNPWPDMMDQDDPTLDVTEVNEIIDTDRQFGQANTNTTSTMDATYDTNDTNNTNDTTSDERLTLSRWAGTHFNKPSYMEEKMPPPLMRMNEMESTRMLELYRIHSAAFELREGDTLVFIDYPVPTKPSMSRSDCNGVVYKSQKFRVHSKTLLETNSSKFAEMLGPTYQFRIKRRRKLVNKLPEDVKYVLDLTPPSEGDELVFQMTELSLTPGIIKWWNATMTQEVDSWLVCGHDDVCKCGRLLPPSPKEEDMEEPTTAAAAKLMTEMQTETINKLKGPAETLVFHPETILRMKARGENSIFETPNWRQIPDYCPIRHRNGILRLLMLLEGKPAILDSAARVWTLVKLCKIFDCTHIIRDRVAQWIMHGLNTRFIEVLPEEALQIAFTLELPQVAQSAFRILVNELALKEADTSGKPLPNNTTIFGRKLEDLPDEISNLVQHAARALVERISGMVATLTNPDMFDYWEIPEWNRLRALEQILSQESSPAAEMALKRLQTLMKAVVHEITNAVESVSSGDNSQSANVFLSMDQDRATYVEPKDYEKLCIIMRQFNPVQLFLCATPYNNLGASLDQRFYCGNRTKLPGHKGRRYDLLVYEATKAFQKVVDENPVLSNTEAWKQCFDPTAPAQFIGPNRQIRTVLRVQELEANVMHKLRPITLSWLRYDIDPPLNITRHLLLTLTSNEMKFLPLWAGGCDDGTGGVFEEPIPLTDMGPSGPGPSFHTGLTIPSQPSSVAGSMIEDLAELRLRGSTTAGSIDVHDSISTVYRPDRVIADDASIVSEEFTVGGSEYHAARFEVPADNQSMGSAVNMLVETTDSETQDSTDDREMTPEADDDDGFWNESDCDYDSDGSVVHIE